MKYYKSNEGANGKSLIEAANLCNLGPTHTHTHTHTHTLFFD